MLTIKELNSLTSKDVGRKLTDEKSLYGLVKSRGKGIRVLFRWRYRFDGKQKDYSCGTYPNETLSQIRANAAKARSELRLGKDPNEEKRLIRLNTKIAQIESIDEAKRKSNQLAEHNAQMTITELFNIWEKKELTSRKDKGLETRRSFIKDVFPAIGNIPVGDIKRSNIVNLLDNVVERGAKVIARNLLGDLRQMFGFAILRELAQNDPTSLLKRNDFGQKNERERVLSDDEIRTLSIKVQKSNLALSSIASIWIMLSTCCRVGELCRAKWSEVDFDNSEWKIPSENAKNAKEHKIYLSKFAIEQLKVLKDLSGDSKWVLPAKWKDSHVCLKTLAKQIGDRQRGNRSPMKGRSADINSLELPSGKWTPHDLRRTGATIMGTLGIRPDVIEKCLNHVERNTLVRIYQRQKLEIEQSNAWHLLGDHLTKLRSHEEN